MNNQIIIYKSNEDFIQELLQKANNLPNFILINNDQMFYSNICFVTPYGDMKYPTEINPYYKEYISWLKLPYWQKMSSPPVFYSN